MEVRDLPILIQVKKLFTLCKEQYCVIFHLIPAKSDWQLFSYRLIKTKHTQYLHMWWAKAKVVDLLLSDILWIEKILEYHAVRLGVSDQTAHHGYATLSTQKFSCFWPNSHLWYLVLLDFMWIPIAQIALINFFRENKWHPLPFLRCIEWVKHHISYCRFAVRYL